MMKKASPYERETKRVLRELLPVVSASAELRKKAGYPPSALGPGLGLDVTFVSRAKMKSLNRKFRGKDAPTDVLSFPALEVFARQGHLGDLVICEPILESQAKDLGHTPREELHVLLVHGLLHLLGYDHEISAREAAEMAKWEVRLLHAIDEKRPKTNAGLIHRVAVKKIARKPVTKKLTTQSRRSARV